MTFVITQPCIDTTDQSCVEVCPVDCIHFEEGADRMLYINPLECIDCGACQPACPVSAIFPEGDVPADQRQYIAINAQWYEDPAAARAQVSGAPAPVAPAATPAAAAPAAAAAAADAAAPAATPAPAAAPAARGAAVAEPVGGFHVEADASSAHPLQRLPSPVGVVSLALAALGGILMFAVHGTPQMLNVSGLVDLYPEWIASRTGDGWLHANVLLGAPLFLLCSLVFLKSQLHDLGRFAAAHDGEQQPWRQRTVTWRRSEEHRRYEVEQMVQQVAAARFAYPNPAQPALRTHVNLPRPTLALEFGGGGGDKVFPDILVVQYPGNYPRMVAQVETRETVTREQAQRVWANLVSNEAPLYVYVPAGLAGKARDYARAAGIEHVRVRTWRRQPWGLLVEDL